MQIRSAIDEAEVQISAIQWHDSKLFEQHVIRDADHNNYHVRLDFDLVQNCSQGKIQYEMKSLLFRDCRLIQTNLELFGFPSTRAHIAEAQFL